MQTGTYKHVQLLLDELDKFDFWAEQQNLDFFVLHQRETDVQDA